MKNVSKDVALAKNLAVQEASERLMSNTGLFVEITELRGTQQFF